MKNRIYEHLKTRKKFNTLQLKYDVKCDELQAKIIELNTEKKLKAKQQELYDSNKFLILFCIQQKLDNFITIS